MSEELTKDVQDALRYAIYSTPRSYGKSFFNDFYSGWATEASGNIS